MISKTRRVNFKHAQSHYEKFKERYETMEERGDLKFMVLKYEATPKDVTLAINTRSTMKLARLCFVVNDRVLAFIESYVIPHGPDEFHQIAIQEGEPFITARTLSEAISCIVQTWYEFYPELFVSMDETGDNWELEWDDSIAFASLEKNKPNTNNTKV